MSDPIFTQNSSRAATSLRLVSRGTDASNIESSRKNGTGKRRKPRVFIIDDQFTGRKILSEIVQSIDCKLVVKSFADSYEALQCVDEDIPDLILTDYKMPALDGVEFTRRLRKLKNCGDIPLIMVTVVDDPEVKYMALDAGATDFIVRPVDQYECRARCRNLLTLRRQQKIIRHRAKWLEKQVSVATQQIRMRERETLLRLAKTGEYRDEGMGNHVLRIAKYSRLIARQLALSVQACDEIELAAPLHDIGKIGIPDNILLKSTRLLDEEWNIMMTHTTIGHGILKDSPSRYIQQGAIIALGHHEKFDGTGYPSGLKGEEIPLIARIVAVADVYDALTSKRPHKSAWNPDDAWKYIKEQSGRHFDPFCVDAFIERIDKIREIGNELRDIE